MNISEAIVQFLHRNHIDTVFCTPGAAIYSLIESVGKSGIRLVNMFHEQSLIHASVGYSSLSNNLSVVLVSSGPGISNTITGIIDAQVEQKNILLICGYVELDKTLQSFQEFNPKQIFDSLNIRNYTVKDAYSFNLILSDLHQRYLNIETSPTVLLINNETLNYEVDISTFKPKINPKPKVSYFFPKKLIARSNRTIVLIGNGINSQAGKQTVKELAIKCPYPIVSTFKTIGMLSNNYKRYLGFVGYCGSRRANYALENCDLIIQIGNRKNNRQLTTELNSSKKSIIVTTDKSMHDSPIESHTIIDSDGVAFIHDLIKESNSVSLDQLWISSIMSQPTLLESSRYRQYGKTFSPISIVQMLKKIIIRSSIVVTDCGQHQLFIAQLLDGLEFEKFITPGNFGVMGSGLPYAIGMALKTKNDVICVLSDGGLLASMHCLKTIAEYNLNIKVIMFNNKSFGLVKQNQKKSSFEVIGSEFHSTTDFHSIATSFGIKSMKVNNFNNTKEIEELINSYQFIEFSFSNNFEAIIDQQFK